MRDWPIVGSVVDGLNWLTITIPIGLAYVSFEGVKQKEGTIAAFIVAIFAFVGILTLLFFSYKYVGFPFWMRWFA